MKLFLLDIDGVLANFVGAFCKYYNQLNLDLIQPFNFNKMPIEKQIGCDKKTYESFKHLFRVTGKECLSPKPIKDSALFTRKAKEKGYSIVIWTSRPIKKYPKMKIWTKKWLDDNGFLYDSLNFVERGYDKEMFFISSKELISTKFEDIEISAVDDRPLYKELQNFVDNLYIFNQPYNINIKEKHLIRIKSLLEIL